MLVINDIMTVPSESWTYYVSPTGQTISTRNFYALYPMIQKHCQSNNVPVPSEQDVIDFICANAHVPCYESETRSPLINKFNSGVPNFVSGGCSGCGQKK